MKLKKINNIIIFLFMFHILVIQIFSNYIILPFNTTKHDSSSFVSKNNYYTLLSLGQPKKTLEIYLILKKYNFYLGKGLCRTNSFSNYIPDESETFKNYSKYEYQIEDIKNAANATDNYFLYANDLQLKKNITIEDMQFYYGVNTLNEIVDKEKICGIIGFNFFYKDLEYKYNYFTNILKQKNIISSYTFSFIFFNNYTKNSIFSNSKDHNNFLIIGMNETEILKSLNTNDLTTIKLNENYSTEDWYITFDEIYLNFSNFTDKGPGKEIIRSETQINFDNEFDYIFADKEDFFYFLDNIFGEYIDNYTCAIEDDAMYDYYFYLVSCDLSFKKEIKKFPDINFKIRDINFVFTLTNEELFIEFNQKIYFTIVNEFYHKGYWTFGNIFLKKYPFIFNYDRKAITFINITNTINNNNKISKNEINYLSIFLIIISIIASMLFGVFIGKIIWVKAKKKRANELVDDYEYNINEDSNEQKLNENGNIINN